MSTNSEARKRREEREARRCHHGYVDGCPYDSIDRTPSKRFERKVAGRQLCDRCGWRRSDHSIIAKALGNGACWRFTVKP